MSCNVSTITDTSSLYRNGSLIERASASFNVKRCNNIDLKICHHSSCYCNRRVNQICFTIRNDTNNVINNGNLNVRISAYNKCCCNCKFCHDNFRTFYINNLNVGCRETICMNLPFNCCVGYMINAQIEVNGVIEKEDSIII